MENVIPRSDHVITAYRDHAHYLGRGGTVRELFAELLGKKTGKNFFVLSVMTPLKDVFFERLFSWQRRIHAFVQT